MTTGYSSFCNDMRPEKLLEQLGFSKNETQVYLAALESGTDSAQNIAKIAGLPRTTTYAVLEYLVKRGVVAKTLIREKTRFVAEPPRKLISTLKDLQEKIQESLPELEARYNKKETKPRIIFYEGSEAIQKVYDDTLAVKPEEILEWNTDAYFQFDRHKVDPHYIDKRVKLGIKAKRIAGKGSGWDTKHKRYDVAELSETAIVPKDTFWPEIEVNIYGNKVAFLNYEENMSVIIESNAIADSMRQAYKLSWIGAQAVKAES